MIEAIGAIIVYEVILIGIVDQSKENKSSEYILIMKAYKLGQIIRSIHQGSDISIHTFKDNLSSKSRLNSLKKKQIKICSVFQLLKGLVSLNISKFICCLFFFILTLGLTVSAPFILNFILSNFLSKEDLSLLWLVVLVILYKTVNTAISIICNFLYSSIGFEYFAFLYWHLLNNYEDMRNDIGKRVNVVQYDCNLITNVVFSSLTSIFYFMEIMVLFGLLISYLAKSEPNSVLFLLISAYLISQCLVSLATFTINRSYMFQKDRRLGFNVSESCDEKILKQRAKELNVNTRFLLMKMVSKFVSVVFPILINIYVFLIADRNTIKDNQYSILILINLIRSPIAELMTAMNLNAQILNSCRRIVELSGTNTNSERLDMQQELIPFQNNLITGRLISKEKGTIVLPLIWKSLKQTIEKPYWFIIAFLYLWLIGSKFYGNIVTQHIMAGDCSIQHYIGLFCQCLTPVFLYFVLIISIQKVSLSLFTKLKKNIDYETLNRISGDIAAIDRSVTINTFQIGFSLSTILSSYLYSIISLGVWWLEILLIGFLSASIWAAYSLNRFIMKSRRQVTRRELQMKAFILKGLLKGEKIGSNSRLRNKWCRIFQCKQMGLFIENYYMLVVSVLMLLLSLLFILLSEWLVTEALTKSILLVVCLSIDRDMMILFFAMVRLQLSLVSFQRVLNVLAL